ncbi:thioredoxin family protein [Spongisporangium articulatum]|uniref:Thioredoxin family protein n=1 Tax=Spongisporangium articulatum TaxID=3362603 RepID=A0ABW8ATG9_9ACTN
MDIAVIYFDGCPSWRIAENRLQEALNTIGASTPQIRTVEVSSEVKAQAAGFAGSPTILIDGTDLFPVPRPSAALACRLYSTPSGLAGSPTVAQLVLALSERTRS